MSARDPVLSPTVSVVIPTHNRPQLLIRAVRSVVEQDYPGEIECVVVFDKAPPRPLPLETGPGRSIRTLTNTRTPGLAGARNAGTLASSGDLIGFLDDDDEWLPSKLHRQVELMQAEGTPFVACGVYICRGSRQTARAAKRRVTHRDLLRSRHMEICACTMLVERTHFLKEIGLVDEVIPGSYAEDYEWALRAAKTGDIIAVEEPLVRIYWHGSSYFARDWETIGAAQRYLLAKHPDFCRERAGLARISGQISLSLAASGKHEGARAWARKTWRLDPRQPRAYLAVLASAGVVSVETMLRAANLVGRGL
jgi:glycosyltransferase involved in cell wall biosynthesis